MTIAYAVEPDLGVDEFIDVLTRSTLAERRPVQDPMRMEKMLRHADIICTARVEGLLVGIARSITDYCYCTYLSDLAVDQRFQRRGIGQELMKRTHAEAGLETRLLLISAPKAESYYPRVGLVRHESCWMIAPSDSA